MKVTKIEDVKCGFSRYHKCQCGKYYYDADYSRYKYRSVITYPIEFDATLPDTTHPDLCYECGREGETLVPVVAREIQHYQTYTHRTWLGKKISNRKLVRSWMEEAKF